MRARCWVMRKLAVFQLGFLTDFLGVIKGVVNNLPKCFRSTQVYKTLWTLSRYFWQGSCVVLGRIQQLSQRSTGESVTPCPVKDNTTARAPENGPPSS